MASTALIAPFHISKPLQLIGATRIPKATKITTWKLRLRLRAEARGFGSSPDQSSKPAKAADPATGQKKLGEDEEDEIPQVVIERMGVRIVASVLLPMGLGLGSLAGFGALEDQNLDVPFWVPVATSFLTFGASALGIAYGALSSSWDPDRKGSLLGLEQLERNWVELWKD